VVNNKKKKKKKWNEERKKSYHQIRVAGVMLHNSTTEDDHSSLLGKHSGVIDPLDVCTKDFCSTSFLVAVCVLTCLGPGQR